MKPSAGFMRPRSISWKRTEYGSPTVRKPSRCFGRMGARSTATGSGSRERSSKPVSKTIPDRNRLKICVVKLGMSEPLGLKQGESHVVLIGNPYYLYDYETGARRAQKKYSARRLPPAYSRLRDDAGLPSAVQSAIRNRKVPHLNVPPRTVAFRRSFRVPSSAFRV